MAPNLPNVWLLNFGFTRLTENWLTAASWNHASYKPYEQSSAMIMMEYDAVVWRTQNVIGVDAERSRQLLSFLESESKLFVFLIDTHQNKGADLNQSNLGVIVPLLHNQDTSFPKAIKYQKQGRNFILTPQGQISAFREYLEYRSNRWFLSVERRDWVEALAVNAEEEAIAFSLSKYRNRVFFLPAPVSEPHAGIFLNNLLEAISRTADIDETPPTWTNKFKLPGMEQYQRNIDEKKLELSNLEKQVEQNQLGLRQLSSVRDTLLSGDGPRLEKAVIEVLIAIGYQPVSGPKGQEDVTFQHQGKHFLAEVKGATSSASEGHIKQLNAKQTTFVLDNKLPVKGVLIINPWRQHEPSQRETEGRVIFPDAIKPLVEIWKFCLMTSVQLFVIYQLHLKGKLDPAKLSEAIHSTVGPLKGYELKG